MPAPIVCQIGGFNISLIADQPAGEYYGFDQLHNFKTTSPPDISLHINCGHFPPLPQHAPAFETTHQTWQIINEQESCIIKVVSPAQDPYQVGIFPKSFQEGDIFVAESIHKPGSWISPLSYPLGELMMMNLLGTGYGMLFHACGVIDNGSGLLFVGHGGAGKTTTSRFWDGNPGVKIVNDDKVIVRKLNDDFHLFGTPWHGEGGYNAPDSAPLRQIYILRQAAENAVTPMNPVRAVGMLLARTFMPLWDKEKVTYSLQFLDELTKNIPCKELSFRNNPDVVNFVRNLGY